MTDSVNFTIDEEGCTSRLDVVIARHIPSISRTTAGLLARDGHVRVNGREAKPSYRVNPGDRVEVDVVLPPSLSARPQEIPLSIVYRDGDLAIVDKPAGLVVHPSAGHEDGTLANALASRFPQTAGVGTQDRPGIVHRLDKDTSGLMVVALTAEAHVSLQHQIAERTAGRAYLALTAGRVEPEAGTIDAPIGRDPTNRKKMAIHGIASRPARTSYEVLEYLDEFSYLQARLHSGRTHQIRVHFAAIGHPLAGDAVYQGPAVPGLHRQFLHAYRLTLRSPGTGEQLEFVSPLPPDLRLILARLRGHDLSPTTGNAEEER